MISIKDLKNGQIFYGKGNKGQPYRFKSWENPYLDIEGYWAIDCTDEGDFCFTFNTKSEPVLFLTEELT
jgi:hypothetical protein